MTQLTVDLGVRQEEKIRYESYIDKATGFQIILPLKSIGSGGKFTYIPQI